MEVVDLMNKKLKLRTGRLPFILLLAIFTIAFSAKTNAQATCIAIIDSTKNEFCVASGSITFSNAIASGQNIEWLTSGDGVFNDRFSQNPTYTPGTADTANGYVFIYLDVYKDDPVNFCSALPVVTLHLGNMHTVATPGTQTVCSGSALTGIVLTGGLSTTIYNWTRNNTVSVTGAAASGTGTIRGSVVNTTTAPVTVTFTITPTAGSCTGTPITATAIVNPKPVATATPATQTICSGSAITAIALSSGVTGSTYSWTRNNTASVTGIAASGTGNITGTLTNTSGSAVTVTFTIIPTANGCAGNAITTTVVVNPTANVVTATPALQTICSGSSITNIVSSGGSAGTVYNWTRNNTVTVTGIAASGSGNISGSLTNTGSTPVYVTFTITPTTNSCANRATVLVNPRPVAAVSTTSQTICSGTAITPILLSSATEGTTFAWTRNNTGSVTGIAASGTGDITGALTSSSTSPVTVTFTITPTANGCAGTPVTATIVVNRAAGAATATPLSQTICSGSNIISITASGGGSGATYNWTRNNTAAVTGIAASGSGNITGALNNISGAAATVAFTIIPILNGCTGTPVTTAVLVNSRPTSVMLGSQALCAGYPSASISIAFAGTAPWNFTYTDGSTPVTVTGNNSNPYTFTVAALPKTYTVTALSDAKCTAQAADLTGSAVLSQSTYTITAAAGANGTISPNAATVVNCGNSQAYTITPNAGFNIQDVLVDGISVGTVSTYTFNNVTSAHSISAVFSAATFTINASTGAEGNITPSGILSVAGGSNQTFIISANTCHQVADVIVDGISQGPLSSYTFTNITSSHTISVVCSSLNYAINATAGLNGTISPSGESIVGCGANQTYSITPNAGFNIQDVLVDGVPVGAVSTYTFSNVTSAHSISATFNAGGFTINASAGADGTITPSGAVAVTGGSNQTFTISANSCRQITDVLVDGISVGAVSNYTFSNITAAHSISATFSVLNYGITASAGANGAISAPGLITVSCGSNQTYSITPNAGFNIQDVLVDGISAGAVSTYTFNNVTAAHTISAVFSTGGFTITASAGTNGTITPSGAVVVTTGTNQTFNIAANSCYQVAGVLVDGISVGAVSTYTFTNVTAVHTISATFLQSTYVINANAGLNGSITPAGSTVVNCGANQTYNIAANAGFNIQNVVVDGISQGPISTYTFNNVTITHTISATFSAGGFTITASAGTNGTITPPGAVGVAVNGNQTFNIAANSCYQIANVLVDGASVGAVSTYTFFNVTAAHSISATFIGLSYTINASAGANGSISSAGLTSVVCGASQTYNITPNAGFNIQDVLIDGVSAGAVSTYTFTNVTAVHTISAVFSTGAFTITAGAGANGTITPSGAVAVTAGGNQTFSIAANSCYQITDVLVDGISVGAVSTYTFTNVTAAHSISATFSALAYSITATAGTNGSISPNGLTVVSCGANQTYNIIANAGFVIQDVLVDGISAGAVSTYTFTNVTAAHSISAAFSVLNYTITATAGSNGSITPAGAVNVPGGSNQTFSIAANSCYQIADVLVDGISVGAVSTYTFNNVTATHTISAVFSLLSYTVTATAGTNGSISPAGAIIVNCGASQAYIITPNAGFTVQSVLVDGVSQGVIGSYTFNNVTAAHSISVSFVAVAGCTAPTLSSTQTNILCRNAATGAIILNTTGGTAPFTYSWTGPNNYSSSLKDITTLLAGAYTVTVTATGGCSSSRTVTITQPATALVATAAAPVLACNGTTTTLTVTASGGTGTRQYSLNGGAFQAGTTFTVDAAGSPYTVTVRDANLCTIVTNSVTVAPAATAIPAKPSGVTGPDYGLCGGGTFTYNVIPVAGATGYYWTAPTGFTVVAGQNTAQAQISVPSSFTTSGGIWATSRNACGSSEGFRLLVNAVLSYPSTTISGPASVAQGQSNVQYSLPNTAGATYAWVVPTGASVTSGQGTNTITVTFGNTSGNVGVNITNACGAGPRINKAVAFGLPRAAASDQNFTSRITGSNTAVATQEYLNVYPNPAQGIATVVFGSLKTGNRFEMTVSNSMGKVLFARSGVTIAGSNLLQVDLGKFANGMYLVKLTTEENSLVQKLFKEK